jgi:hypothetical protein
MKSNLFGKATSVIAAAPSRNELVVPSVFAH